MSTAEVMPQNKTPDQPPAPRPRLEFLKAKAFNKGKLYLGLLLLMLPVIVGMALFTYYPQYSAVKYSFYDWDGQQTVDFIGWNNYREAFTKDKIFWPSFMLTLILLIANAIKMWPSIFVAVVMHRIRSERFQYIYRVLFVIPMIIPGLVMLLIWKSFFDANNGVLNKVLNGTGLRYVLQDLDVRLPQISEAGVKLGVNLHVTQMPGGLWGLLMIGAFLLSAARGFRKGVVQGWVWWAVLTVAGAIIANFTVSPAVIGNLTIPGYCFVLVWLGLGVIAANIVSATGNNGANIVRWIGRIVFTGALLWILAVILWPTHTKAFDTDAPNWLGKTELIIPSLVFWGFPWVGTVGVLLYLAGLQAIPLEVYEAGELDGIGSIGRLFRLELPLIMTQVRINLIFMTIGTLTDYGLILLLLGAYGGPGSKGMVPGLYAYNQAFIEGRYGYACALGMVMFVIIMGITILYQKYVKVDK